MYPVYALVKAKKITAQLDCGVCAIKFMGKMEVQICSKCSEALAKYFPKDLVSLRKGLREVLDNADSIENDFPNINIVNHLNVWMMNAKSVLGEDVAYAAIDNAIAWIADTYAGYAKSPPPVLPYMWMVEWSRCFSGMGLSDIVVSVLEMCPLAFWGAYVGYTLQTIYMGSLHDDYDDDDDDDDDGEGWKLGKTHDN
jgi:hypothetical protein